MDRLLRYFNATAGLSSLSTVVLLAAIPGLLIGVLTLTRNSVVSGWARSRDFDFMFRIQRTLSVLNQIFFWSSFFVVAILVIALTLDLPVMTDVLVANALLMLAQQASCLFLRIFRARVLATLCIQSFLNRTDDRLMAANRTQLTFALRTFDRLAQRFGVSVPYEELAFCLNICLMEGVNLDEHLNKLAGALGSPTSDRMKDAINSCTDLLYCANMSKQSGLQVPRSFWGGLTAVPPMVDLASNVLSVVVSMVYVIMILLGRLS
jgi:hypothetical protein